MNAASPKERTNMFLDRISFPPNHHGRQSKSNADLRRDHPRNYQCPFQSTTAIQCARMLLGSSPYKRKSQLSPVGCWVDVSDSLHPSADCDSDISDSESEDEEIAPIRESRWSSNPSLTGKSFFLESNEPLRKIVSVDTSMTLPKRKGSVCDLKNMAL